MASGGEVLYDMLFTEQQKAEIEKRAAKDADQAMPPVVAATPVEPAPKPKKKAAPKKKKAVADEPVVDEKPASPKKKKTAADETKKDAAKKPLTGAAAQAAAKKKAGAKADGDKPAGPVPERHAPGFSMIKAERDRIDRALTALKRRVASKAEKDLSKGKKPVTTVCRILNVSLIKFYSKIREDFQAEFSEYLEAEPADKPADS